MFYKLLSYFKIFIYLHFFFFCRKENERNRDAVYRLNVFLDHQINYFDEMTKPLLKQCQKILSDGYVDKVQNKILSAVNQLQLK